MFDYWDRNQGCLPQPISCPRPPLTQTGLPGTEQFLLLKIVTSAWDQWPEDVCEASGCQGMGVAVDWLPESMLLGAGILRCQICILYSSLDLTPDIRS